MGYDHTCDTSRITPEAPAFEVHIPPSCPGDRISRDCSFPIPIFSRVTILQVFMVSSNRLRLFRCRGRLTDKRENIIHNRKQVTLYMAVITHSDFPISCLLNAFTFYPYIILSPKKKLQRCPKDHPQSLRIRPESTRLPFRVRILYILQVNFQCHCGWKERQNQTKQRIDAHRNASSSKIMPNTATLFKANTPEKVTGAEVIFFHIHCRAQHPFCYCWPLHIPMLKYLCRRPFFLGFFFCK